MEDHPRTGVCMVSSMRTFKCDCQYASGHSAQDSMLSVLYQEWFVLVWDDHYSNQCSLVLNRLF